MANIIGTASGEVLIGTSGADSIEGLAGDDILSGGLGDDTLNGGEGYDPVDYLFAPGPVTVNLAAGTSSGADGNDVLISIEDAWGSDFGDVLLGDAGDNVLRGQRGNDTLNGGAGYDVADYFEAIGPVAVNLASGTASGADGSDVLIGIEDVWGSVFDDILVGDAGANFLYADSGNDILAGGPGDDTLGGGAGTDSTVYVANREDYNVILESIACVVTGPDGADVLADVERLWFADKDIALDLGPGEAAANTVRIIGAAFGAEYLIPEYVGIGIALFDGGMTMLEVCQFALDTNLFLFLAGSTSDADFVNEVYENVVGVPPSAVERDYFAGLLVGSGGTMTQAQLLMFAANTDATAFNIDLAGLQESGVEFI